jgi:hypothetical protein
MSQPKAIVPELRTDAWKGVNLVLNQRTFINSDFVLGVVCEMLTRSRFLRACSGAM